MPWAPDYCTVEELADWLGDSTDDNDDRYAIAIGAASRLIDQACNRQFGSVTPAQARTYAPYRCGVYEIDDLSELPTGVTDSAGNAVTGYTLGQRNAPQAGKAWTRLLLADGSSVTGDLTVTASWGWAAVPDSVKMACLLQAARFAKRRESPFGISGSPQAQGELRLLARLDPDVAVSLRPVMRQRLAG